MALNPPPKVASRAWTALGWVEKGWLSYEEAIAKFRTAIRLDPPAPDAVYGIGASYVRLKKFAEARATHQELLRLDPEKAGMLLKEIDAAAPIPTPGRSRRPDRTGVLSGAVFFR